MATYLVFPNLAAAQARSNAQAVAKGCVGDTQYWWGVITNSATGQAALTIDDSGDYGSAGLAAGELAALESLSTTDTDWFPPPIEV